MVFMHFTGKVGTLMGREDILTGLDLDFSLELDLSSSEESSHFLENALCLFSPH